MKKWLSRGIVLAMIIAMMVPMPVAAASSKGGKQIKNVEVYNYNDNGVLQLNVKAAYKYDSKGNVEEEQITYGFSHFGPIAWGGDTQVTTFDNKYKGKTLKSVTAKDAAGAVRYKDTYKKGNVVKSVGSNFINESGLICNRVANYSYTKKGFASAAIISEAYSDGATETIYKTYALSTKKGLVRAANINWAWSSKYTDGSVDNGSRREYAYYNDKGFCTESGYYNDKGVAVPWVRYSYQMKSGRVASVTALEYNESNGTWKATTIWKFSYNKAKVDKADYAYNINDKIGAPAF